MPMTVKDMATADQPRRCRRSLKLGRDNSVRDEAAVSAAQMAPLACRAGEDVFANVLICKANRHLI